MKGDGGIRPTISHISAIGRTDWNKPPSHKNPAASHRTGWRDLNRTLAKVTVLSIRGAPRSVSTHTETSRSPAQDR